MHRRAFLSAALGSATLAPAAASAGYTPAMLPGSIDAHERGSIAGV